MGRRNSGGESVKFATARRHLQRAFPIRRRVIVTRNKEEDPRNMGTAWLTPKAIRINVAPDLPDDGIHILSHEWAHGRIYDRHGKQLGRHTHEWVKEYAVIYRHFFDA